MFPLCCNLNLTAKIHEKLARPKSYTMFVFVSLLSDCFTSIGSLSPEYQLFLTKSLASNPAVEGIL